MKEDILTKAKMELMLMPNTVFYSTILFSLKTEWREDIPTAATNGTELFINPEWFIDLPDAQRIGLLVHEVLHVALNHMSRRSNRHPKLWNTAADHVINLSLLEAGHKLPPGLYDERFTGMTTEQVYDILYLECEEDEANGGSGADGLAIPGGEDIQYPEEAKDIEIVEKAVNGIVQNAKILAESSSQMPGILPGEALISLRKAMDPELPWHVIFQNYMSSFAKEDFSWKKPNRRYLPDLYLPSAYSEAVGEIAVAVDASGSVEDHEFLAFITAIETLQETLEPEKIKVVSFDTEIQDIQEVTPDTNIFNELKFTGRGGTDVGDLFLWAQEENPEVLIIFTDGDFFFPSDKYHPTCPIVWLIHGDPYERFKAPIGEIIFYNIERS